MSGLYLGFDFGRRRIGVAAGQAITVSASPVDTITASGGTPDWGELDRLVQEWQPAALVVGIPVHMDGTEQSETQEARAFARRLENRYGLAVHEADERLSSREAADLMITARQRGRRPKVRNGEIDRMAAVLILERWLAQNGRD